MLTIRDGDGQQLATALADASPSSGELVIQRVVQGKGHLLHHYFGRGLRMVLVDSGDSQLHGTLSTRWLGAERQWIVRLNHAAACRPITTNQTRNSPQAIDGALTPFTQPRRATAQPTRETVQ